jgi:hypothetical protein
MSGGGLWGLEGGKAVGEMPFAHYSHAGDALSRLDFVTVRRRGASIALTAGCDPARRGPHVILDVPSVAGAPIRPSSRGAGTRVPGILSGRSERRYGLGGTGRGAFCALAPKDRFGGPWGLPVGIP